MRVERDDTPVLEPCACIQVRLVVIIRQAEGQGMPGI